MADTELFIDHRGRLRPRPPDQAMSRREGIHAVIRHDWRILLVQPPGAEWLELPGGGIEPGEDVVTALLRELREEAGAEIAPAAVNPAPEVDITTRYYASSRDEYWLYRQRFRLVDLTGRRPELGQPLEPGHRCLWLNIDAVHDAPLHHIHRLGLDRLLVGPARRPDEAQGAAPPSDLPDRRVRRR